MKWSTTRLLTSMLNTIHWNFHGVDITTLLTRNVQSIIYVYILLLLRQVASYLCCWISTRNIKQLTHYWWVWNVYLARSTIYQWYCLSQVTTANSADKQNCTIKILILVYRFQFLNVSQYCIMLTEQYSCSHNHYKWLFYC